MVDEGPGRYWSELRSSDKGDGRLEIPSRVSEPETGYGPVRFALGTQKEPRFLVPCSSLRGGLQEYSTSALAVFKSRYRVEGRDSPFIDLVCRDPALSGVFAELVNEINGRLSRGEIPEQAVMGAITDFRSLLVSSPRGEIPRETVLGLVGELYVLDRLVEKGSGALNAWLGPHDERHDFRAQNRALEVKTLSRPDATEITISSFSQLLAPVDGALVLAVVRLDESSNGELTVASLVQRILRNGGDWEPLRKGLENLGCQDPEAAEWNRNAFAFHGIEGFEVVPGFPRLTEAEMVQGSLPVGISRISYTVDLANAGAFRMEADQLESYLREMSQ